MNIGMRWDGGGIEQKRKRRGILEEEKMGIEQKEKKSIV